MQYDLLAGIAVGFTVVPQAMSYANIAGVPAVMGLYGAFTPILLYSLFGSSKQLGVGPVAVTSGLIFSGLSGVIPGYEGIMDPNDPKPDQVAIQVSVWGESSCPSSERICYHSSLLCDTVPNSSARIDQSYIDSYRLLAEADCTGRPARNH